MRMKMNGLMIIELYYEYENLIKKYLLKKKNIFEKKQLQVIMS